MASRHRGCWPRRSRWRVVNRFIHRGNNLRCLGFAAGQPEQGFDFLCLLQHSAGQFQGQFMVFLQLFALLPQLAIFDADLVFEQINYLAPQRRPTGLVVGIVISVVIRLGNNFWRFGACCCVIVTGLVNGR